MHPQESKATEEEIYRMIMKCQHTECKKYSIIEDNGGWRWCWKHFWWQRDGYFSKMRKIILKNLFR